MLWKGATSTFYIDQGLILPIVDPADADLKLPSYDLFAHKHKLKQLPLNMGS